jgi:phage terminase large subunit
MDTRAIATQAHTRRGRKTKIERFANERLGLKSWPKLAEIYDAFASGKRKILVRSCNGAGKTTTIASLVNFVMTEYEDSMVLSTASSWTQVRRGLWGEIRAQARRAKLYAEKQMTTTGIELSDKHYAIGLAPTEPENAQGFHAPRMLIVVDEATGVDEEIINALWGNATSAQSQMVMIYNPINIDSMPYELEQKADGSPSDWHLITISAFDHPNVISGKTLIPGAVTREWIEDRLTAWSYEVRGDEPNSVYVPWLEKHYKKTDLVACRILGEWPDTQGEGLLTMDIIRAAVHRRGQYGLRVCGVDVARSGKDRTVFSYLHGTRHLGFRTYAGRDLMRTADLCHDIAKRGWIIAVDDTGLGGGVTDRLRQLGHSPLAINFGAKAFGLYPSKPMANARAEMYFTLEHSLRHGGLELIDDKGLHQELASTRIKPDFTNGYQLEDKKSVASRLGRSPDKADATALAVYGSVLNEYINRPHCY